MSKFGALGHKLYTGEISYDFIRRRRLFYIISAVLLLIALGAVLLRGLNWGIEFRGGADFQAPTKVSATTVADMRTAVEEIGLPDMEGATVTTIGDNTVRIQTRTLSVDEVVQVREAIAKEVGTDTESVAYSLIGASWGGQITKQAVIALVVFLALVSIVIWIYFRNGKMSIAALVALLHDLVITIGIYALVGWTVTPATLIGVLTILGYSLYDTVVVFDKVRENVRDIKSSTTKTYSEGANLAVNQVLVRSINTTIIGVLPVAALLFAGAFILGTGPLKDLALALFVGMIAGAYSSIFIATPLLAQLKEREPDMIKLRKRVENRRAKEAGGKVAEKPAAAVPAEEPASTAEAGDEGVKAEVSTPTFSTGAADSAISLSVRPLSEGAAKRPQPQHKPRSQRKK